MARPYPLLFSWAYETSVFNYCEGSIVCCHMLDAVGVWSRWQRLCRGHLRALDGSIGASAKFVPRRLCSTLRIILFYFARHDKFLLPVELLEKRSVKNSKLISRNVVYRCAAVY